MNRNEFISLCQLISVLPDGIAGTLENVPSELMVQYDGITYYPLFFELKFKKGQYYDVAVLHSLKANCIMHVPLKEVIPFIKGGEIL